MCDSKVTLFYKAGHTAEIIGTCHESQRILMVAALKKAAAVLPEFTAVPVSIAKPPKAFTDLGLRLRVPAMYLELGDEPIEPFDVADEIVAVLEYHFPGGLYTSDLEQEAERLTRDFFSRFCYWMRGVSKSPVPLEAELRNIDQHLTASGHDYLCGPHPSFLDCELLPKLHQVRVAAASIKGYKIPTELGGVWRLLHSAYCEPAFTASCPPDSEILLHWLESPNSANIHKQQHLLAHQKTPMYSFSVPAIATPVVIE